MVRGVSALAIEGATPKQATIATMSAVSPGTLDGTLANTLPAFISAPLVDFTSPAA